MDALEASAMRPAAPSAPRAGSAVADRSAATAELLSAARQLMARRAASPQVQQPSNSVSLKLTR
jgi:hypothetical protein